MKQKGFTLVELLAIIVILSLIVVALISTMSRLLDDSKEKAYNLMVNNIESAAHEYLIEDRTLLETMNDLNPSVTVYLSDLYMEQLLTPPLKDPRNNKVVLDTTSVVITLQSDGDLTYTINFVY